MKAVAWDFMYKLLIYALLAINLIAFAVCGLDKRKAKKNKWRISEKALFLLAAFGGGFGMWAGMYLFRHKTKHWYFVIGIPLIALTEYGLLAWVMLSA